nr:IS3 family transposase [Treponema sp.]
MSTNELFEYLSWYNEKRIKVKLKGLTPLQFRNQSLKSALLKWPTIGVHFKSIDYYQHDFRVGEHDIAVNLEPQEQSAAASLSAFASASEELVAITLYDFEPPLLPSSFVILTVTVYSCSVN